MRSTAEYNEPVLKASEEVGLYSLFKKDSIPYHVFRFIHRNYGQDLEKIIKVLALLLGFIIKLTPVKFKKTRRALTTVGTGIPVLLYGPELYMKAKDYIIDINRGIESTYDKNYLNILKLLNVTPGEEYKKNICVANWDRIPAGIIYYVFSNPNTSLFKITGYYNIDSLEKISKRIEELTGDYFIEIDYNGKTIIWWAHAKNEEFAGRSYLHVGLSRMYGLDAESELDTLYNDLNVEYVKSLNIKDNVLRLGYYIEPQKRKIIPERIDQINVPNLVKEIKKVLKAGKKRTYAFVGVQGTGKSSIVRKIEEYFPDTIILHLTHDALYSPGSISNTFTLIRSLQPLIAVIEDLDSYDVKKKNERVGAFINELDGIAGKLNMVLIKTINDTSLVHSTILDRPERTDEIKQIFPPKTPDEVYNVLSTKFKTSTAGKTKLKFPSKNKITKTLYDECINNNFTQATLASMIDKVFLEVKDIKKFTVKEVNDALGTAIEVVKSSKQALKDCYFDEKDPLLLENSCEVDGGLNIPSQACEKPRR